MDVLSECDSYVPGEESEEGKGVGISLGRPWRIAPKTSKTLGPFAKNGSPQGVPFGAPFEVDFRRILDPFWSRFWSHFGSIFEPILDNFGAYVSLCLE